MIRQPLNVLILLSVAALRRINAYVLIPLCLLFALAISVLNHPVYAQEPGDELSKAEPLPVTTKVTLYANYLRIVFSTEYSVGFGVAQSGSDVYVDFGQPIDLKPVDLSDVGQYVSAIRTTENKQTIVLSLLDDFTRIRRFVGEGFIGIDVMQPQPEPQEAVEAELTEEAPETPASVVVPTSRPLSLLPQKAGKNGKGETEESPVKLVPFKPAIKKRAQENDGTGPIPRTKPTDIVEKVEEPEVEEEPVQQRLTEDLQRELQQEIIELEEDEIPIKAKDAVIVEDAESLEVSGDDGKMQVGQKLKIGKFVMEFPWTFHVSAAAFARGEYVWVIFNAPVFLDFNQFKKVPYIASVKQLPNSAYTILRVRLSEDYYTKSYPKDSGTLLHPHIVKNGTYWRLELIEDGSTVGQEHELAEALAVISNLYQKKPRVLVATGKKVPRPLPLVDPEIGDTLIIFPLEAPGVGVHTQLNYVDFNLLSTAQGVVIQRIADSLQHKRAEDGISIYSAQELSLSPELFQEVFDEETEIEPVSDLVDETIIPFQDTTGKLAITKEKDAFVKKRQQLYRQLVFTTPEEEKSEKYYEISSFFFQQGLYADALGVLRDLQAFDSGYDIQRTAVIMGVCHFMLTHYKSAHEYFRRLVPLTLGTPYYDEMRFWEWISSFYEDNQRNKRKIPVDYISAYDKFMAHYPTKLRYEFGLAATQERLNQGQPDAANAILEIISYQDIPPGYENSTAYLRGKIAEAQGKYEEARTIWEVSARKIDDRYNRARAGFDLTKMLLINGEISKHEAILRLERLSHTWRGDAIEIDRLKLLGQLYIEDQQFLKGLKTWQKLVTGFPQTKEALFIAGKMKQTFIQLFDGGDAYDIPPLEALALYFEFRELTPVGEQGDRIVQQLTNHFIEADLLDNAASLMAHQLRFRTKEPEKRHKMAIHLAELYLQNKKPRKVFDAIANIDERTATPEELDTRRHLEARAYQALREYGKVFEILDGDFSIPAQDIRLGIFNEYENWFGIMSIIEPRLEEIRDYAPFPLRDPDVRSIMQLAVAYAMQEEEQKLAVLKEEMSSRIPDKYKKKRNIFSFVTEDIRSVNHLFLERSLQLQNIESFVNEYAFWPDKDWENTAEVLALRVNDLKQKENLTPQERNDVVRLALSYVMLMQDPPDTIDVRAIEKKFSQLQRDFRQIRVDKFTVGVFGILDDKFIPMDYDQVFVGSLQLADIPNFVGLYRSVNKMSDLNQKLEEITVNP